MVTDVTDLRCAHEAIRRSEQQMRAITENSPDLIIRLDCAGRLMFANRALLDYLLMNDRNVQGMSVDGLWQDDRVRGQWRDAFGLLMNGRSREDIVFEEESCGVNRVFQAYLVAERVDANVVSVLAVIRDITEMRQAEQLLRESRDRLRLLAAEYEMVLEAEKRHIARELHDETGQILSALRLNMGMLGVKNSVTLAARLEKMAYLLDRATASIRQVVTNLRPAVIDMGLVPALEWLCDDCSRLFPAITYSFDVQGELPEFNENAIILVFRMAQEALNNATRHAQASRISVCLTGDANGWQLIVEDDGSGFDVPGRSRDRECFGLLGLRERALAVGGDLDILSQSGAGTRVILAVTTGR
jgi:PAS domain S-box-containing protein